MDADHGHVFKITTGEGYGYAGVIIRRLLRLLAMELGSRGL